jgi:hypothetical protein
MKKLSPSFQSNSLFEPKAETQRRRERRVSQKSFSPRFSAPSASLRFVFLFACVVGLFTGCAATRTLSDVGFGAGGAALGGVLGKNHPAAIAAGAAGGILLSEGLHYAAKTQSEKSFATGYDRGRSDAVKQQYWLQVARQQQTKRDHVRLYEVHLPEQTIDGVIFQPTTQFLRIDQ